jgi:type II secretory pathway pseudopilin PulG
MLINMSRRGFTIVELVVIIAAMGILLIIGFVNVRGVEATARDAERKTDIETLILQLDAYYRSGADGGTVFGKYPSTSELIGNETSLLRDLDTKSIMAPGQTSSSLVAAQDANEPVTAPTVTINTYIYQPLQADGSLCTTSSQECRRFNLYYRLESDNTVYSATGKNQ